MTEKSDKVKTAWKDRTAKEKSTPKFLKAGTLVMVDPKVAPQQQQVEGKFGKRAMWIIQTKDYGLVYITPVQMIKLGEVLETNDNYNDIVTVAL
jgi:hypothetical protein